MDMKELWARACELLQADMNEISYRTWIGGNLAPARLEGDTLTLRIAMENMKGMVCNRYVPLIANALFQVAGHRLNVEVLTQHEIDEAAAPNTPAQADMISVQLNPKYTFDTFVVGSGNRFAHAAALAVAESPVDAYNPLFIWGGVGLGKTHLMHAVGHYIRKEYPEKRLLYVNSETFTNELITAIQQNRNQEFRNRFRNVDILMVDDIQFIAGRESTQEEFFNTFNALHSVGKQIILTSDRPPQDIARLEERLRSRFSGGLIADIQRPDLDTRVAILREKARQENVSVGGDVLELIATNVDSNIRELEGNLTRLIAYANLVNEPITMALCREALPELFDNRQRRVVTVDLIMRTVADYYSINVDDLTSKSRRRQVTVPRQIAMYLTREMTGMSLPQIGMAFAKDHSTVVHSCDLIADNLKTSQTMISQVNDLRQLVTGN